MEDVNDETEYSPDSPQLEWDPEGPVLIELGVLPSKPSSSPSLSDTLMSQIQCTGSPTASPETQSQLHSPFFDPLLVERLFESPSAADHQWTYSSRLESLDDWDYFEESNPAEQEDEDCQT